MQYALFAPGWYFSRQNVWLSQAPERVVEGRVEQGEWVLEDWELFFSF